ncbi:MAG: hypothetical protein N3A69_17510, partial [Leptospiraceae bacterium]|nr:hypothetical protein [Leptospiraceae bacterium]
MREKIRLSYEKKLAEFTEFLTSKRSFTFIQKLQLVLVTITLAIVTYFLSYPYLGQEKIDLSPEGPFAIGVPSPETILSTREIIYPDERKTQIEREKAYNSGAYIFDRDYNILSSVIFGYISEEI